LILFSVFCERSEFWFSESPLAEGESRKKNQGSVIFAKHPVGKMTDPWGEVAVRDASSMNPLDFVQRVMGEQP
jgi:hypothetical protein